MKALDKKGQGLSLTTIIVAAIALIVLVVLVMIFTGRIGVFKTGVEEAGEAELVKMRISYGDCRPTEGAELSFKKSINEAASEVEKETAKNTFRDEIDRCKSFTDKDTCRGQGCAWK